MPAPAASKKMPPKPWPGLQFLFQEWIEGRKKSVVFNKKNETKPAKDQKNTSKHLSNHPSNNLYWGPQIANLHHTSKNIPYRKKIQDARSFHHFCSENALIFFSHPETGHLLPQKSRDQNPKPDLGLLGYSTPRRYQCSGHLFGTQPVVFGRFMSHLFLGRKVL